MRRSPAVDKQSTAQSKKTSPQQTIDSQSAVKEKPAPKEPQIEVKQ